MSLLRKSHSDNCRLSEMLAESEPRRRDRERERGPSRALSILGERDG